MALQESTRAGEFLLAEGNGTISRSEITLSANCGNLDAGTVLGVVTATGHFAAYNAAAEDGSETAAGVLYAPVKDAASAQSGVAIVRHAEVMGELLIGLDADSASDLAAIEIIVR